MKKNTELIDILKELYIVSGFRMSLYDAKRNQLYAYPAAVTPFCSLVQSHPKGIALCHSYDREAFDKAQESGEVYLYRCHCGLYEAVAPLYHFGVLSGYLMMGQTLDTMKTSQNKVYEQSVRFCGNKVLLWKAIKEIPLHSKEQILSCISIMEICAEYITLSNYLKAADKDLPSKVRSYISQNYGSKIHLDELCSSFYCSRATLTSSFRKVYGQSITEYLTHIRLEQSRKLLRESELSIQEIAEKCGFTDQNYFTKVFRKAEEITPSQYRDSGT